MAILDLFSTRNTEPPDVFVYDQLPRTLRVQMGYILRDALGSATNKDGYATSALKVYDHIVDNLCRHFGLIRLAAGGAG